MAKNLLKNKPERNPLEQSRMVIEPVNIYKPEESTQVDKTTKPQEVKTTSKQVVKTTKQQVNKTTSSVVDKATSGEVVKEEKPQVEKYTTHLTSETIKAIKLYAVNNDMKDYEIVQKALNKFLGL